MQLVTLTKSWDGLPALWVSFDKSDVRSLLRDEEVVFAHGPTNRSLVNLVRNLRLAWKVVRETRPKAVVTTGAGVAVPFCWIGRLHGARIVYIESLTRIESPSLTLRLIRPFADRVYVQWPELASSIPGAVYAGSVFSSR